jgi:hypothetical protein
VRYIYIFDRGLSLEIAAVDRNLVGRKKDHFRRNFAVKVKNAYFEIFYCKINSI